MRPFTVLIGIILGSAASITFGLGTVLIVFCVLGAEHPELPREMPRLAGSLAAFAILTAASAGSFLGQAKARPGAAGRIWPPRFAWAAWFCCIGRAAAEAVKSEPYESYATFGDAF